MSRSDLYFPRFEVRRQASQQIREMFAEYTSMIERENLRDRPQRIFAVDVRYR